MKNLFIITGASKGIGRAFAIAVDKHFSKSENTYILIARDKERLVDLKKQLNGNVKIVVADLANVEESVLNFEETAGKMNGEFDKCVLFNNAGIIKPIGFLGKLNNSELAENIKVNLIAPLLFTNSFLKIFGSRECEKIIINNSSGAGRMPIVCWSAYCASKAGMDMFSKVLSEENSEVKVFSVAPGIIETDMQKDIRSTSKSDFPLLDEFINFQRANVLKTPEQSAEEFVNLIKNPDKYETIVSF